MSFRQNLKDEIYFSGISVKELSYRTGIPYTTIESYINNKATSPSLEKAFKISSILGVSLEYLLTGKNRKYTTNEKEAELVKSFNRLTKEQQKLISELIIIFCN